MVHVSKLHFLIRPHRYFNTAQRHLGTSNALFIKQTLDEGDNRKILKKSIEKDWIDDIEDSGKTSKQKVEKFDRKTQRSKLVDRGSKLRYIHERAHQIMTSTIMVPGASKSKLKPQFYNYFLVLDFEATCEEDKQITPQEIIEFPVLKINSETLEIESTFHQYVQPRVHKELSPFCTRLTGIMQSMVDGQPHIEETLEKFHSWMLENKLLEPDVNFLFVTCGDWDLLKMLPKQCGHFKIDRPKYFKEWLNIKKAFAEVTSTYPRGMMDMLSNLNIPHQGRHHSGIDDCKNIGNILTELLLRGYVAKASGRK